jgi:hypothetical protein
MKYIRKLFIVRESIGIVVVVIGGHSLGLLFMWSHTEQGVIFITLLVLGILLGENHLLKLFVLVRKLSIKEAIFREIYTWPNPEVMVPVPSNPSGQFEVLLHDGGPVSMDCTKVSVLKETNQVSLSCLLDGQECLTLETQLRVILLSYVSY